MDEHWDTSHQTREATGSGHIMSIPAAERWLGPSQPQPAYEMGPGNPPHCPKNRAAPYRFELRMGFFLQARARLNRQI